MQSQKILKQMINQIISNKIKCDFFQDIYYNLNSIKSKINKTGFPFKVEFANELMEEANYLLECRECGNLQFDCTKCLIIAQLYKKTANLIINDTTRYCYENPDKFANNSF